MPGHSDPAEMKSQLRLEMRARLASLDDRARRSLQIVRAVAEQPEWLGASFVALFAPMKSEPDVEILWPAAGGRTLCLPRIRGDRLEFAAVPDPARLVAGGRGIREPEAAGIVIPPERFDVILVPGAAFSRTGDRLGRGGGFYDRLLAADGLRGASIGVCFDAQLVDSIPGEAHDRRVDRVITESGVHF